MRVRYLLPAFVLLLGLGVAVLTLTALAAPEMQPVLPQMSFHPNLFFCKLTSLPAGLFANLFPGPWPWFAQAEITIFPTHRLPATDSNLR
jgi:hypothetical protein